jgi:hypothetical protein
LASEAVDAEETPEERRQRWYLRKVEGGGFVIQLCAVLMAWLSVEDAGMRKFVDEKVGLDDILETVKGTQVILSMLTTEQLKNVEEVDDDDENAEVEKVNAKEEKEILEVLIDILGDGRKETPANGAH